MAMKIHVMSSFREPQCLLKMEDAAKPQKGWYPPTQLHSVITQKNKNDTYQCNTTLNGLKVL